VQVVDVQSDSPLEPMLFCNNGKMTFFDENHTETPVDGNIITLDNAMYIPIDVLSSTFGIEISWSSRDNAVTIRSENTDGVAAVEQSGDLDNYSFAYNLNELMPDDKNYVFSPIALRYVLAATAMGSQGSTKNEILNALGISDLEAYQKASASYSSKYAPGGELGLYMANSVWLNDDHAVGAVFKEAFERNAADSYNAEVKNSDNKNIVNDVNLWSKNGTNKMIPSVISTNEFLLYGISSVFYDGSWERAFNEDDLKWENFTSRPGNVKHIPLMHTRGDFRYYEDDNIKIVSLPYSGGSVSMYVVMSGDKPFKLEDYIDKMQVKTVDVKIPRFKTDYDSNMKDILTQLGIKNAFDPLNADIPDMIENDGQSLPAYLTDVIQRTYFKCDEDGDGEAVNMYQLQQEEEAQEAKLTDEEKKAKAESEKPMPTFYTYSPFTYIVRDNSNGEILLMGEYAFAVY
jgi:serpin B